MVRLLARHNGQQYVIAVADATNTLKGFCYLSLLGIELCYVVKVLEVAPSTGAKVRAGGVSRVGVLLESAYFAGFSITCRESADCNCFMPIDVASECLCDRQQSVCFKKYTDKHS